MSTLRKAIESFDPVELEQNNCREVLDALVSLANTKRELFNQQIQTALQDKTNELNKTVPISEILSHTDFYFAQTSEEVDAVEVIEDSLSSLISSIAEEGKTWDSITKAAFSSVSRILGKAVNMFLGDYEGAEREERGYQVAAEGPSLIRLDYRCWYRKIEAQGIKTKMNKIVVYSVSKSTVDVSKMSFNGFINVYMPMLVTLVPDVDLPKLLERGAEIFKLFGGHMVTEQAFGALPVAGPAVDPKLVERFKEVRMLLGEADQTKSKHLEMA